MAEAVGLGASILTFITVAAGLSKANAALYGSIKDAQSDVQSVQTRLKRPRVYTCPDRPRPLDGLRVCGGSSS